MVELVPNAKTLSTNISNIYMTMRRQHTGTAYIFTEDNKWGTLSIIGSHNYRLT